MPIGLYKNKIGAHNGNIKTIVQYYHSNNIIFKIYNKFIKNMIFGQISLISLYFIVLK